MSKKRHEILKRVHLFENNIPYEKPALPPTLHNRTLTSITNALDAEAYLDPQGRLWITKEKLHSILRTTKANANDLFDSFEEVRKIEKRAIGMLERMKLWGEFVRRLKRLTV